MMSLLDWRSAMPALAGCADLPALRKQLLDMGETLGTRMLGVGVSSQVWRALGMSVVERDIGSLSGYCQVVDGQRIVLVNRSEDARRQRFTVAHELAHLLMGNVDRAGIGLGRAREERLCNEFARTLLVPPQPLCELMRGRAYDIDSVLAICTRFGVSLSLAVSIAAETFADRGCIVFAAGRRGHPRRPDEVALRTYRLHCGDVLVPDLVRVCSLGLPAVEHARPLNGSALLRGRTPSVELRLWRPDGHPRSGRTVGPARWEAKPMRSNVTLVRLHLEELEPIWANAQRGSDACLAA